MAESASQDAGNGTPKIGAPKDKNCPYCGQAFTSSSLGRHLDLYIKEKNPKPPDGVHDVEAIKLLRGTITRRQPRASLGGRHASTPVGTPKAGARKEATQEAEAYPSPALPKDGHYAVDTALSKFPFTPTWQITGVINDIPARNGDVSNGPEADQDAGRRMKQRAASKQIMQKAQFDVKLKLADAMDTARAAELALREILSSFRAAKLQIDHNSMPFDFDPLSLDFPALTLQCLEPPPTLFSSTQHPTSTSWSVQSPGQREYDALRAYFQEEFRQWKIACASATTAAIEEMSYPPPIGPLRDAREGVKKAEKSAELLERQVNEHLQSAYTVWDSLSAQRRTELWVLELARGVGRRTKEISGLKDQHDRLKQENANLKLQLEQLNRLQQPREFKIVPPTTIPLEKPLVMQMLEQGVKGARGVGLRLEDRQLGINEIVVQSIERWKDVIAANRTQTLGMNAQKPLDQSQSSTPVPIPTPSRTQPQIQPQLQQPTQVAPSMHLQRQSTTSTTAGQSDKQASVSIASTTGPPSVDESSDQDADADADAEMEDDDSFAVMNTPTTKPPLQPMQRQATLEVPRTRGAMQRGGQDSRFMMQNGNTNMGNRTNINMSRSMPNMQAAMPQMHGGDLAMAMSDVRGGDAMYMD